MDSYKVIEEKLRKLEPFRGNSMSAVLTNDEYTVFSYSTPIARHAMHEWRRTLNPEKYSTTTSRHQNLVKKAWGL